MRHLKMCVPMSAPTLCRVVAPLGRVRSRTTRLRCWGLLLLTPAALGLWGCGDISSVDAPDVHRPEDYATAAGASALATGAMTRFTQAFGGTAPTGTIASNQVTMSGLIADELSGTAVSLVGTAWDQRDSAEPSSDGSYTPLHSARINLLTAISRLQDVAPDSSARIGQLFALLGYTELFFAENFCSGVPLSRLDPEFRPVYGPPLTSEQMYDRAVADFDSALSYAADSARIAQLARVGQGRALLNLGRFSEAARAVASVPTSYVYSPTFIMGTLHNSLSEIVSQIFYTVPEREGTNGLPWRTANDPRVPLVNRSPALMGIDGVTEVWAFRPYLASNAPIRLASGVEARLIEAEAALQAGDAATWLNIHNTLRATVPDQGPLSDPGTPDARVDMHFRERAFWLYLTGHRHGDLRRLVRQYGRDAESVFPTGAWREGLTYGPATHLAPPRVANNDPTYVGCLNREA